MTAVKGPFPFTSDGYRDSDVQKAKAAGCRSIALQLGVAPAGAKATARGAGLQVIGWGICGPQTHSEIAAMQPDVWMPQAENTVQFEALVDALPAPPGLPVEPVMTSGGMETEKAGATDAEKVAERHRRRDLLRSFGVTKVWVEVYLQDAHRPGGNAVLGNVDAMIDFFVSAFGFLEAHPVIGLWTVDARDTWGQNPYSVSKYDLRRHGRDFGFWRTEQMADARYAEVKAWLDSIGLQPPPPDPDPPPTARPNANATRQAMRDEALPWLEGLVNPQPQSRIKIADRILGPELGDTEWRTKAAKIKAILDA